MTIKSFARIAGLLLLSSVCAFAQGGRYDGFVLLNNGRPASSATVRVCQSGSTGTPCGPLASIYSDLALGSAINQTTTPLTTDSIGNFTFYAVRGVNYDLQISGTGITTRNMKDVSLGPGTVTTNTGVAINGDTTMTAAPRLTVSCYKAASAAAAATADCLFTLEKAATIVRILAGNTQTAPVGCSTAAKFGVMVVGGSVVSDVAIANTTLNADSGAISVALALNTPFQIGQTVADAGCSTHAGPLNITVIYKMQ